MRDMSYCQKLSQATILILGLVFMGYHPSQAGTYLNSAHGTSNGTVFGVERGAMTDSISGLNYANGNCAHCHEAHASLEGAEPAPVQNVPSAFTLFAPNFDTGATPGSYIESSNLCFYCHSNGASVQQVVNNDYSATFGGAASSGALPYIMETFNQASFHDIGDIHTFIYDNTTLFPWYDTTYSNPCNGCHNPHLAKQNKNQPLASAISKPSAHFSLWGEAETMADYGSYEPPYANAATGTRESGETSTSNGTNTPDYSGFCTDCHDSTKVSTLPYSSKYGRTLLDINWSTSGDKHGGFSREDGIDSLEPYTAASSSTSNFVLSCLDCHEPHGSANIMLLRTRINGSTLDSTITSTSVMGSVCRQCHQDDAAANGGSVNAWEYAHHQSSDRPYAQRGRCGFCHPGGPGTPISCDKCHTHGSSANADYSPSPRKTF